MACLLDFDGYENHLFESSFAVLEVFGILLSGMLCLLMKYMM